MNKKSYMWILVNDFTSEKFPISENGLAGIIKWKKIGMPDTTTCTVQCVKKLIQVAMTLTGMKLEGVKEFQILKSKWKYYRTGFKNWQIDDKPRTYSFVSQQWSQFTPVSGLVVTFKLWTLQNCWTLMHQKIALWLKLLSFSISFLSISK